MVKEDKLDKVIDLIEAFRDTKESDLLDVAIELLEQEADSADAPEFTNSMNNKVRDGEE